MRIPRLLALWAIVAIVLAACTGDGASPSASAGGSGGETACKVGVSWNNYEQPRWAATDQPNIKGAIEAGEAELAVNPRARSAKLRAGVRTDAKARSDAGFSALPNLPPVSAYRSF